ncbi:MULE transposase domain-containing protein [Trichomonas vaginalis G3]|uniref:MULE transposase domain-containing protein n=1 Tax=Trichomonas vaginalis (strain ATCC PRA-98 / G3) TaxID=412133 RepID=UPI0021E558FF|nr:MULE transposase domain-containing protein [Trichomonas vaginalis G3]KAI5519401.1 MULE transposase domain-containing protein [Trichomonas vaginalis G3]
MELLQFGIQEEIKASMGYSQKCRKEYSTIEYKCKYPQCQAKFKVRIIDQDKYELLIHSDSHDHSAPPKSTKTISSLFVRNYLKHYFENNMNHATAQLKCFQDLNISYTDEELLSIFAQGPDALRKFAQRAEIVSKRFSSDEKVSLAIFVESVQESCPEDLIEFISEPGKLVFYMHLSKRRPLVTKFLRFTSIQRINF